MNNVSRLIIKYIQEQRGQKKTLRKRDLRNEIIETKKICITKAYIVVSCCVIVFHSVAAPNPCVLAYYL